MSPTPPNANHTVWVSYHAGRQPHEVIYHFAEAVETIDLISSINDINDSFSQLLTTDGAITGARLRRAGTNFSIPISIDLVTGSGTAVGVNDRNSASYFDIIGRGATTGRFTKYTVFTPMAAAWDSFRIDLTDVDAMLNWMHAITDAEPAPTLANGDFMEPYGYFNVGYNSYWTKAVR